MSQAVEMLNKGKAMNQLNPMAAMNLYMMALEALEIEPNEPLQLEVLIELCFVHKMTTSLKEGFKCASQALELAQKLKDLKLELRSYNYMGIFCFYSGLYKRALNYFYDGLEKSDAMPRDRNHVSFYTNIGETYKILGNLNQGLYYFERAYELAKELNLSSHYTPVLCNLGDVFLRRGDLESAEALFNEADEYKSYSVDISYCAELEYKKGILSKKRKNFEQAYHFLQLAEYQYKQINNRYYLIDVLLQMTELSDWIGKSRSEDILNEAKMIAVELMDYGKMATIEYKLHELACERDAFEMALNHYKEYHEYAAKSDAKHLLNKIEIMNIENTAFDHVLDFDLKDFANLEIFSNQVMDEYMEFIHKDLQYKAYSDELTGLANRRKINDYLKNLKAPHQGSVHGILIVDIDFFKSVNDNEGHLYGDRCLMRVARVLKEWAYQKGIFVGRYGGEEFLGLIENTQKSVVIEAAENLRQLIEEENIVYHTMDAQTVKLTVSIGCALGSDHTYDALTAWIDHADQSLYQAKAKGRNRIEIYEK